MVVVVGGIWARDSRTARRRMRGHRSLFSEVPVHSEQQLHPASSGGGTGAGAGPRLLLLSSSSFTSLGDRRPLSRACVREYSTRMCVDASAPPLPGGGGFQMLRPTSRVILTVDVDGRRMSSNASSQPTALPPISSKK